MKTFVRLEKPSYTVKEKDGIVICNIKACFVGYGFYDTLFLNNEGLSNFLYKRNQRGSVSSVRTFTGVARLKGTDDFDEIKGKRIAESKCKAKIYKYYLNMLKASFKEIHKEVNDLNERIFNLRIMHEKELVHIKDLDNGRES